MSISDTTTVQPRPASEPQPPRRKVGRWILAGAGVSVAGLLLGLAFSGSGGDAGRLTTSGPGTSVTVASAAGLTGGGSSEPTADQVADEPEIVDEAPVEPAQTDDTPDADDPQPATPVAATLVVTPDPIHLQAGIYTGQITVSNAGDEAMQWTAATKPWVSLSDTTGELGAHGENVITFTIDKSELEYGSFSFKIKVWGNGGTTYVDVTGAKPFDQITI